MPKHKKNLGWTVFIVECADGLYFTGLCKDIDEKIEELNKGKGYFFSTHPDRVPVKPIYVEKELIFKEAWAKSRYLKMMTRKQKKKLISTGVWPLGGQWKEYVRKQLNRKNNEN